MTVFATSVHSCSLTSPERVGETVPMAVNGIARRFSLTEPENCILVVPDLGCGEHLVPPWCCSSSCWLRFFLFRPM